MSDLFHYLQVVCYIVLIVMPDNRGKSVKCPRSVANHQLAASSRGTSSQGEITYQVEMFYSLLLSIDMSL